MSGARTSAWRFPACSWRIRDSETAPGVGQHRQRGRLRRCIRLPVRLALIVVCLWALLLPAIASQWPPVSEVHARFAVSSQNPHIGLIIPAADGEPRYRLSCHPGDYESAKEGDFDHMYHCKLWDLQDGIRGDLFSPTPGWNRARTRALFHGEQVTGRCADHPYYGSSRSFRFLGMDIRLAISELRQPDMRKMLTGEVQPSFAFNLSVDVKPDPSAGKEFVGPAPEMCSSYYKIDDKGALVEIVNIGEDESLEDAPQAGTPQDGG